MATPFNTTAPVPATRANASDAQIKFVTNLLAEREWNNSDAQPAKHISRAAVLNMVFGWAFNPMADETPAEVSRVINGTVGRVSTYGERVNAILDHLAVTGTAREGYEYTYVPFTKTGASAMIEWLNTVPRKATAQIAAANVPNGDGFPSAEVVPAGRYAIDTEDGAINATAFYKVDRPETGKWAGYVFVKLMVGGDEQRMSKAAAKTIVARIAEVGAEVAMARYGHEIGECGMCARTLTNDESRARGIGPICATKAGW